MSETREDAANFAILALEQTDRQARSVTACRIVTEPNDLDLRHFGTLHGGLATTRLLIQKHTLFEFLQLLLSHVSLGGHVILFGHFITWMGQVIGKFSVVSEQDQARRVGIESTHWKQSVTGQHMRWQEIEDVPSSVWVLGGGDDALGLVEDDMDVLAMDEWFGVS